MLKSFAFVVLKNLFLAHKNVVFVVYVLLLYFELKKEVKGLYHRNFFF